MSMYKYFYTPFLITEVSDIWIHISFFLTGVINELTVCGSMRSGSIVKHRMLFEAQPVKTH